MPLARALACFALLIAVVAPIRADEPAADDSAVVELYKSGKLFEKAHYKAVRAAFAERFQRRHADEIRASFGDDQQALTDWLNEQQELREDLYTALDERFDKLGNALRIFHDLWKEFPKQVQQFPELAIATVTVWDDNKSVYDHRGHQIRTKSNAVSGLAGARDNFKYLAEGSPAVQERVRLLPREFLAYLVDHLTPLSERKWALEHYGPNKPMIGRSFSEIAYDKDMFKGQTAKLAGHDYTLENIRRYGGVCAMQADYAARVAKSSAIPAAYVHGPSDSLGMHAWVMWVELKQVRRDAIVFTLESHGRYDNDHYYTGRLTDPETGEKILDRDMERRLSVAGRDRVGKRQADLAMRAYPELSETLGLDSAARLSYLDRTLRVSSHSEWAWLELARLAKAGEAKGPPILSHMETLLNVFSKFPDFTWKVFDDLLSAAPDEASRSRLYGKLVNLYEQAGRPDLACEARFKLADLQVSRKLNKTAAEGLAFTIRKFPTEGRYVPKLMEKLQDVCKSYKGGTDLLGKFYLEVLPAIPRKRGDEPSAYCIKMYEQAIAFFKENQKDKVATALETELDRVRRGERR